MTTVSDTLEQPGSGIPGEDTGETAAKADVGQTHIAESAANPESVGHAHSPVRPRRRIYSVLGNGELRVETEAL